MFTGVSNGTYKVFTNAGVFKDTVSDGLGGFTTGCAFNPGLTKLYTTNFGTTKVIVYDAAIPHSILQTVDTGLTSPGGHSESVVFASNGDFYVGHPDGNHLIQKYNAAGVLQTTYAAAIQNRGTDWLDLAANQTTLFYTSEGSLIKRFDTVAGQLTDFASIGGISYALRLLPPGDGSGGLLVAHTADIKRLNGSGAVVQTYSVPGEGSWFSLNLDPNGTSFWAGNFATSNFYRFNITTGAVEVGPINTGTGGFTLFGICLKGEITAGAPPDPPIAATPTTFSATEGQAVTATVANFTDPDANSMATEYSATIDWGDSTPTSAGVIAGAKGGPFAVSGTHAYKEEGTYTVTVTIKDTDNASNTATAKSTAKVADAALTAKCATPAVSNVAFSGNVATFTDAASPSGTLSDFSATIAWGDTTSSPGTVSGPNGGPYTVSGSHTYSSTGIFTIKTTINDVGGSTANTDDLCHVLIFAFARGGDFVIGNLDSAVGTAVEFWGAQWSKRNDLSGGSAPDSFKGFEDTPQVTQCGTAWTTDPGNSTPPPAGSLPAYMGVVVSSSIGKTGEDVSGNTVNIVIVKTNPGYDPTAPDPGHAGTGTVVATVC